MAIDKGTENIHIKLLVEQRDLKGFLILNTCSNKG